MIEQKYILDANVFITSKNSYYDPQFHPGFWKFLDLGINNGAFILPRRVYEEVNYRRLKSAASPERTPASNDLLSP